MARPQIEFFQAQASPWRVLGADRVRPNVEVKRLSYDTESQAASVILRYPADWAMDQEHHLDSDEELFVLAGELVINGISYGEGDYAFLPAGYPRDGMSSANGADALTFFDGAHINVPGTAPNGLYDASKLVKRIPTRTVEWGGATDPKVASAGVKRLGLRQDSQTGDTTWLLDIDETGMTGEVNRLETHPVVEEVFLLSGEFHMPMGVLQKGAYFWRPPGIAHGPVGTRLGALGFFRCKGGPLTTDWSEESYPVPWDSPYEPILPDSVVENLTETYDPNLPY